MKPRYMCWGNVKMKGKPELLMPCRCCVAFNQKRFPTESQQRKTLEKLEGYHGSN